MSILSFPFSALKNVVRALVFAACASAASTASAASDGYPVANFALTVNASANGDFFGEILRNPGRLGQWLQNQGEVSFEVAKDGKRHPFSGFGKKNINRAFPFVEGTYAQSPLIRATMSTEAFCPLEINSVATTALPVLLLSVEIAATEAESFELVVSPKFKTKKDAPPLRSYAAAGLVGAANDDFHLTVNTHARWDGATLKVPVSLSAKEKKVLRFALSFYDEKWVASKQIPASVSVNQYAQENWNSLREKTKSFSAAIPRTGDAELDTYLRWYLVPAVSLTKCTANNEIVTMGYRELNQRDSYWTSWIHLVLFKDAEKKMLEESIQYQQNSGKIPTTILPKIERHDDLDINAFFVLRMARYYAYHKDTAFLRSEWKSVCKAMDWLISRDSEKVGLPAQVSLWGDWKDVRGVEGRRYSPFSGLVYLAALKKMVWLARELGDAQSAQMYEVAYKKGHAFINKPVSQGGLWNGTYYCQVNKDGSVNDKLLQDQTIGILYGVVPLDRAEKIIAVLNEKSLTPYGIAETTPYYPASFGYEPATYHNGAVWPWLSFMDCWARAKIGRKDEAISLVKRVANADLVASGDWSPNEHINSITGKNLGFHLQGWNSGLFGFIQFGILEKDRKEIP